MTSEIIGINIQNDSEMYEKDLSYKQLVNKAPVELDYTNDNTTLEFKESTNVKQINDNLDKLTDIKNEFQSLENIYLDKLEQLNIPYAKSLGFVESEPNDYVRVYRFMAQNSNHAQ